ncbi:MAG: hypothetical protein HYV67_02985 [Candidatus Taylorbacteria bacterium]|nr:hypothetical protein [Candidatus Taylorbacteria bacterium]
MTYTFRLEEIPEFFDISKKSKEASEILENVLEETGLVPSHAFRLDLFETCIVAVEQIRKIAMLTFLLDGDWSLMEQGLHLYTDYDMSLDLFFEQLQQTPAVSEHLRLKLCELKEKAKRVAESKDWNIAVYVFPSSPQEESVLRENWKVRGHSLLQTLLRVTRRHMDDDPHILKLKAILS